MLIRAVVWKELREQGLIGLTLLVVGGGLLIAAAAFADPPMSGGSPTDVIRTLGLGRVATLMLAVTAGMVCGGALFAAEREAGTMGFLESLPATRRQLWLSKVLAGGGLASVQIVAVLGASEMLGLLGGAWWARAIAADALLAFSWGAFGSTFARTTLGSVGVAIPFAILTGLVLGLPVMYLFGTSGGLPRGNGTLLFSVLMLVTPLAASAVAFTRPDRSRSVDAGPRSLVGQTKFVSAVRVIDMARPGLPRLGLGALVWLASRQLALPLLVTAGFAFAFGLALLLPMVRPVMYWPPLALAAGVLAGVSAFTEEQGKGVARFWAERRLPVGRFWTVKIAAHILFALGLLILLAVPSIVRGEVQPPDSGFRAQTFLGTAFRSRLFDELQGNAWTYLLLPAGYGFAAGHLCGLLFRKAVVAAGVAGLVGGALALAWVPSTLAGGLSSVQVWTPVLALLATGRLLMRPWSADRLLARRAVTTLVAGTLLAVVSLAAGLGYRVLEIPNSPDAAADVAFVNSLPPLDANTGGRDFVIAARRFAGVYDHVVAGETVIPPPAGARQIVLGDRLELPLVWGWPSAPVIHGWPRDAKPDLDTPFDNLFSHDRAIPPTPTWDRMAAAAAAKPIGVYEDPRLISLNSTLLTLEYAKRMAPALLARGLQLQAHGDPAAFPPSLAVVLRLAQSLRSAGSVTDSLLAGNAVERLAQLATDRWLENLRGSPELVRRVLDLWRETDAGPAFDPRPYFLAQRYLLRDNTNSASQWLPDLLVFQGDDKETVSPEVDLVATAWTVPWERERTRRLLGLGFEFGRMGDAAALIRGRPGSAYFQPRAPSPERLTEAWRRLQVGRRATLLKAALVLYESETGRPANTLDQLVPKYLSAIPADPYDDGRPFRYRLSTGERLETGWSRGRWGNREGRMGGGTDRRAPVVVPAGQGIVWSIGPEGKYADGKRLMQPGDQAHLIEDDFVFLVPLAR